MVCSIERSPKLQQVNAMLAAGFGLQTIEKRLRADGVPIKRETVKRHLERCLPASAVLVSEAMALPIVRPDEVRRRRAASPDPRDFASMVHARAVEALAAGDANVTTRDGLAAQALLERRAERDADRSLVLNLARLLSGAGNPAPAALIDGDLEPIGSVAPGGRAPED